jgi:paired amphipathic helix protein Sin3a
MTKSLITEIETLYREQREKASKVPVKKVQFEYKIESLDLMNDIKKLIESYVDKSGNFSSQDQDRIVKFLNQFTLIFFGTNITSENNDIREEMSRRIFFGNTAYYLFFRFFQMLYSRLLRMKNAAENICSTPVGYNRHKNLTIASSLDLVPNELTGHVIEGKMYESLLALIEKLFDGEIDNSLFEEQVRFWFGTSAFPIYTIDKVVHSIAKQLVHIVTDHRSIKLFSLYNKEKLVSSSERFEMQYRQLADEIVDEEENLYKIEFNSESCLLGIELLGEEYFSDESGNTELKWSNYIDNYVKVGNEDDNNKFKPEFKIYLERTLQKSDDSDFECLNNLECKICVNTYKMFFVENSEDYFYRKGSKSNNNVVEHQKEISKKVQKFRTKFGLGQNNNMETNIE